MEILQYMIIYIRDVNSYLCRREVIAERFEKEAAIVLQMFIRSQSARRQLLALHASVKIQAMVRCYFVRTRYLALKHAVIKIQTLFRGHLVRKAIKQHKSAQIIQHACRVFIFRKMQLIMDKAATILQAAYAPPSPIPW